MNALRWCVASVTFIAIATVESLYKCFFGIDSYFHIRLSRDIDLAPDMNLPWLSMSTYTESFPDHHFLYHIYLKALMTSIPSEIVAANLSVLICIVCLACAFYFNLKSNEIQHKEFWIVVLAVSSAAFLYRMGMVRVQALSCTFMLFYIYAMMERKKMLAFFVSAAFVWLYSAYLYVPFFLLTWTIIRRFHDGYWDWKMWSPTLLGLMSGIIINPLFPEHLYYMAELLRTRSIITSDITLGAEWYPMHPLILLLDASPLCIIVAVILGTAYKLQPQFSTRTLFYLTWFLIFFILLSRSQRFIEYWPVFAVLTCASLVNDLTDIVKQWRFMKRRVQIALLATVTLIVPIQFFRMNQMHERLDMPYELFKNAGVWLKEHTEEREIVYNAGWSDFPQLFYWNPHNHYICGLDPIYMKMKDPERFNLYMSIEDGKVNHPAAVIASRFNVRYAVAAKRPTEFYGLEGFHQSMQGDPCARLVYEDAGTTIYEVSKTQLAQAGGDTGFSNR